jgi:hypothetical protein
VTFTPPVDPAASSIGEDPPGPGSVAPPAGPVVRRQRAVAAAVVGLGVAGLGYVYRFDPNVAGSPYPQCTFKLATGLDCPGCGGTRAVHALLHGDLAGAADHYALIFLVAPVLFYFVVRYVLEQFGVSLPAPAARRWMGWAAAILFLGFTVVRNLPFAPFHYLQSGLA